MNVDTPLSDIKYPNTFPDPLPFAYLSIARSPKRLLKMRAGQGTPRLLVRPRNLGARPSRARETRMREARKREELPAETTVWRADLARLSCVRRGRTMMITVCERS